MEYIDYQSLSEMRDKIDTELVIAAAKDSNSEFLFALLSAVTALDNLKRFL